MITKNKVFQTVLLCAGMAAALSCGLAGSPATQGPDPALVETDIALRVLSTSIANQQLTLQAVQAGQTQQGLASPPTADPQPTGTSEPSQNPTQEIPPTVVPSQTSAPPPLVLEIQASVDTFYCYQDPYELTITVRVSDISRGMAVYYHIRDKSTGVASEGQVLDLHRKTGDTRAATVIGGGSSQQNLQFPAHMGESYFVYQIISDDGLYRSPSYADITFFPCGQ
jgi:hypothetical protein